MATEVLMPKLGLTMTEGTIEEWKFKEGDTVKKGDILFSVATDKLTNDVEAEEDGTLLKILLPEGETAPCKSVIAWIGAAGEAVPDAAAGYVDKALKAANGETPLKGLRVVLDCANGVFSKILPEVFKSLGAGIIVIGNEPNGKNINLNCGSQHTEKMIETVKNAHAQLGIAVDGDGDRIIVCDEQGNRLDGDQIIAFLGKCLKEEGKLRGNTVVATIVSNPALDRFLNGCGIQCVRSAVGERYVIEEMKKHGANVGGEESGHMVLSDYGKTGDAMTAALVLAQGLLKSGKKMSELFPLFEPMLRLRADSKFATKEAMLAAFELPEFQAAIHQAEQTVAGKGKVLVRKSGTEPKIQVWVWSDDRNLAEKVNDEVSSVLEKAAGFETKKLV